LSNHLTSLVYKLDVGSLLRKSVLVLLADKASDDGSGIWASKQTMADELCCSKQAVWNTLQQFMEEGLLVETGRKQHQNGYTVTYTLLVAKLESLNRVKRWADNPSTTLTGKPGGRVNGNDGGGQPGLPKPPRTPRSDAKASSQRGKSLIPSDWTPPPLAELPPRAMACASQWTDASYQTEGEAFVCFWRSERRMKADWRGTWANRVITRHSAVMRDQKFGNAAPNAAGKVELTAQQLRERAEWFIRHGQQDRADECRKKAVLIEQRAA
jgi:biotin operon repressor